jgi:hypothetical protein
MRRLAAFIILLTISSFACGLLTPASTPNIPPATATETAPVPEAFTPIPTFTVQAPTASGQPHAASAPEAGYLLQEERLINGYTIRIWRNPDSEIGFDTILLIEAAGQAPIRVDMVSALHDTTGSDVNGDSYPEVVVETYSGGAHCCFGTQVYSLREAAVLILQKPESNAGGYFEDLDGNYVLEFVTYDDSFAYQYCPYAAGVGVKSILTYDFAQEIYIPASPYFPEQYADELTTNEERALAAPGEMGEWDGTNMCAILPLALDYLYIGQPEQARTEFYNRYSGIDTDLKWNEVLQVVQGSPLFTP